MRRLSALIYTMAVYFVKLKRAEAGPPGWSNHHKPVHVRFEMASRGRKSGASLSVVRHVVPVHPEPPAELGAEAAAEWVAVVETHPLLVAFCQHTVRARYLARQIDVIGGGALATAEGLKRYDRLARMSERETRALSALAMRMRICQHSQYRADKAATAARNSGSGRKPWEYTPA